MSSRAVPPINVLFLYMERKSLVSIWLAEQVTTRIEGIIGGFDEFMNVVVEQAAEIDVKTGVRRELSQILLKGDCITLISSLDKA